MPYSQEALEETIAVYDDLIILKLQHEVIQDKQYMHEPWIAYLMSKIIFSTYLPGTLIIEDTYMNKKKSYKLRLK